MNLDWAENWMEEQRPFRQVNEPQPLYAPAPMPLEPPTDPSLEEPDNPHVIIIDI